MQLDRKVTSLINDWFLQSTLCNVFHTLFTKLKRQKEVFDVFHLLRFTRVPSPKKFHFLFKPSSVEDLYLVTTEFGTQVQLYFRNDSPGGQLGCGVGQSHSHVFLFRAFPFLAHRTLTFRLQSHSQMAAFHSWFGDLSQILGAELHSHLHVFSFQDILVESHELLLSCLHLHLQWSCSKSWILASHSDWRLIQSQPQAVWL